MLEFLRFFGHDDDDDSDLFTLDLVGGVVYDTHLSPFFDFTLIDGLFKLGYFIFFTVDISL